MAFLRKHLSYANVVSTTALFLALGGATAFAATQLAKNSVGTKQLKPKAVTAAKIKDGAVKGGKIADGAVTGGKVADGSVTGGKLADGAVTGGKVADGSVTGGKLADGTVTGAKLGAAAVTTGKLADGSVTSAKLDPALLSAGGAHVVARARGAGPQSRFGGQPYTLNNAMYTQAAGEDDFFVGAASVTIPSTCGAPRKVDVQVGLDATPPGNPSEGQVVGNAGFVEGGNATVTRLLNFGAFNNHPTTRLAPDSAVQHTVSVSGSLTCGPDDEERAMTFESAGVDVIGVK